LPVVLVLLALVTVTPAARAQRQAWVSSAPTSGGTLNVRSTFSIVATCFDPQKNSQLTPPAFDTLVSEDGKGRLWPGIATWKVTNGAKVVTFNLKPGLKFANGDPLNAAAVKYTFDRALNGHFTNSTTASSLGPVKSIQVVDPRTVRFVMQFPFRPLLVGLAQSTDGILNPKITRRQGSNSCLYPAGSGPFTITDVTPGLTKVTLVRNKLHTWNPPWVQNQGLPYLSKITIEQTTSDTTAVSQLLSGQIDVSSVPASQLGRVRNNPNIRLVRWLTQGEVMLDFNLNHAPLNDPTIRRALSEAIDRNAVIKVAVDGQAKPALSTLPASMPFYDKKATQYAPRYDPSHARQVLANAHVPALSMPIYTDPQIVAAAQLIQAELGQVGVTVNIVTKPFADWVSQVLAGNYDLTFQDWSWDDPDIGFYIFNPKGGFDLPFLNNPTVNTLIAKGRASLNPKKAAPYYAQLQTIINKNTYVDPLYTRLNTIGVRSRVGGFHITFPFAEPVWQDIYIKK
jgi:peptide/nickel transport system substrate-binding protein